LAAKIPQNQLHWQQMAIVSSVVNAALMLLLTPCPKISSTPTDKLV